MTPLMTSILAELNSRPWRWYETSWFGGPPPSTAAARKALLKLLELGEVEVGKEGRRTVWRASKATQTNYAHAGMARRALLSFMNAHGEARDAYRAVVPPNPAAKAEADALIARLWAESGKRA